MARRPKNIQQASPSIGRIIQKFWPEICHQKGLLTVSFLALLAETGFRLLEPWPLKFMFDEIILAGFENQNLSLPLFNEVSPLTFLTILAIALVAIAALRGSAGYLSTVGMAIAATQVMTEVRSHLYTHLQRLSLSFHNKAKSGDLITRVTYDIARLREVAVLSALPLLSNLLTMVGMIVVMFWLNRQLAIIAMMIFPLFFFSTLKMSKRIHKVARKQRQQEGEMAATAAEALGAIEVVQALSIESLLAKSFSKQNKKSLQQGAKAQKLKAGQERTVGVLIAFATACVLWRGVQLVMQEAITPGDLLVFINYLKIAFKPMRQLAKYTGQIAKASASGERILKLMEIIPDIQDAPNAIKAPPFRGQVQFKNVSFAYQPNQIILRNLNFEAQPGQRIALVGHSGSGKSTLVSLLLRFYDPLEGQILIDGHDLREYKLDSLRQQMSIVLQDSILFGVSIRDNIAYGSLGATDEQIEQAARLANAHNFIMQLPEGYDTILGEGGANLSGGQRQRISIARAAVRHAPIVILDEPTTGLDKKNEREVNIALERLTDHKTTFVISHNLKAVKEADLILYLEGGQILEYGTHRELMKLEGHYSKLYQLQTVFTKEKFTDQKAAIIS